MSDLVYEMHRTWLGFFHDYYFRVQHLGFVKDVLRTAKHEHLLFITNHALTFEAALLAYYLSVKGAGFVKTLVYPEAFKLPLVREFFRSGQCAPISVEAGAQGLNQRHVLMFPEGMDFIRGLTDPDQMPPFHTGFLRMAKRFLQLNGRKTVRIVPVAHAGIEKTFKFWVVKNRIFMDFLIRPWVKFPFWIIPKFPFLLPYKVVFNWGKPIRLNRNELKNDRMIEEQAQRFALAIHDMRKEARLARHDEEGL